jgi:hypothetical protein
MCRYSARRQRLDRPRREECSWEACFRGKVNVDIRVVIDVSGEHFVDHEKEVLAYLARD